LEIWTFKDAVDCLFCFFAYFAEKNGNVREGGSWVVVAIKINAIVLFLQHTETAPLYRERKCGRK